MVWLGGGRTEHVSNGQVLREGTEDDVRRYVDADQQLELWDQLVLPPAVRRAWADWFRRRRHVGLAC